MAALVSDVLGGKSLELKKFRQLSVDFRSGIVSCEEYLGECSRLAPREVLPTFFPELICLLPDISKQEELMRLFRREFKDSCQLVQCETCSQVLRPEDRQHHGTTHSLDVDFPHLG